MKLFGGSPILLSLALLTPLASASVANFTTTNQTVTLTGLGADASGRGQVRISKWGNCVFDGTTTVCTLSASFTGISTGGTASFVLSYAGNGESPLTSASFTPGSDNLGPASLTAGSFVTTLALTNGTTLTYDTLPVGDYLPGAQCTVVTVANCRVGQIGLTPGATITGTLSGGFDATPFIRASQGVISASAFGAFSSIAPGTWVEIYGFQLVGNLTSTLWSGADFNGVNAPTKLSGTTVTVGGKSAFIDYVSPTQVNLQVPSDVASGQQSVIVTTGGGSSAAYPITVNAIQPGLLAPSVFILGGKQYVAALYPDQTFVLPPGATDAVPTKRAKAGDTILMYGVGFGPTTPDNPAGKIVQTSNQLQSLFKINFAGTPAQVTYQGLTPTFVGLYQFNVLVPNVAANDAVPVTFSVGTTNGSQTLYIPIGN